MALVVNLLEISGTQPKIEWWSAGWGAFMAVVALIGRRRFQEGWGVGAALAERGGWGLFLAKAGFALVPIVWGMGAFTLAAVFMKLAFENSDVFIAPAVISVVAMMAAFVWAAKEFIRPSDRWVRPPWLEEFYQERDRRRS